MRALNFFGGTLHYQPDAPTPPPPGEALIRTRLAGICNTDLEIIRGYMGFSGILGHEVESMIHATYSLDQGPAAFEQAAAAGVLKVLLSAG